MNHLNSSSALVLALSSFGLAACETPQAVHVAGTEIEVVAPEDAVCNPFGNLDDGSDTYFDSGLRAKMYYLLDDQPRYSTLSSFFEFGQLADYSLYFNQLNVPTRRFDEGFTTQNGSILTTPKGDTVYEWFGLQFDTEIELSRVDHAGYYQFASLSDDGISVELNENGTGYSDLIRYEPLTPSRFSCAQRTIYLPEGARIPARIHYVQGPRTHIALMMLWREIPAADAASAAALADVDCGAYGNETWFDYNARPSAPTARWTALLGRGWKVLNSGNYRLPASVAQNPCGDAVKF